jgi:hypothetical protein
MREKTLEKVHVLGGFWYDISRPRAGSWNRCGFSGSTFSKTSSAHTKSTDLILESFKKLYKSCHNPFKQINIKIGGKTIFRLNLHGFTANIGFSSLQNWLRISIIRGGGVGVGGGGNK